MSNDNFLDDFNIEIPDETPIVHDIFDRKSAVFYAIVYEMAMHGNANYAAKKTGTEVSDIKELEKLDYYKVELKKALNELEKDGGDPIKSKANIFAHMALDVIAQQMTDTSLKGGDRLNASKVMLEIAGKYNAKDEAVSTQPITINFKDASWTHDKKDD